MVNTNTLERRPSNPRSRQKRVTVSLPMIQLEIPVERDSRFMDFCNRVRQPSMSEQNNSDSESNDNVPDLIKSVQKQPARAGGGNHSRTSSDVNSEPETGNDTSDSDPEVQSNPNTAGQQSGEDTENDNREILRELNNQLKVMSTGMHPHWIYQIHENEEDTWC